jgi:hypothetical protein
MCVNYTNLNKHFPKDCNTHDICLR